MGKSKTNVEQLNTLADDLAALSWSLGGKQAALVSGVNIKTINGQAVLGSGDLVIAGGGGGGSGDVVGPASATDGAVALFDGATGKLLKVGGTLGTAAFTPSTNYLTPSAIGVTVQGYDATILKAAAIGVTVQGYDAATAKRNTANTFTEVQSFGKAVRETYAAVAASNIDVAAGGVFAKTISGATMFTVSNVPAAGIVASFILELTNPGTNVTFWAGVKWPGGTAPTLTAAGVDVLGFYTRDGGTTWRGMVLAKDSK